MTLEDMKAARFRFLKALYEASGGDESKWFPMFDIGQSLGFDRPLTNLIGQYLVGEHLIAYKAMGPLIGITHYGVTQIEKALSEPDRPTHYFPAVNFISIAGSVVNSPIQQGSHGSHQTTQIGVPESGAIVGILEEIKRSIDQFQLDADERSDLEAQVATVEAQLRASKPKSSIVAECLRSIRAILEGAAGHLAAMAIAAKIRLLGG